jgi:hypothetical protein
VPLQRRGDLFLPAVLAAVVVACAFIAGLRPIIGDDVFWMLATARCSWPRSRFLLHPSDKFPISSPTLFVEQKLRVTAITEAIAKRSIKAGGRRQRPSPSRYPGTKIFIPVRKFF